MPPPQVKTEALYADVNARAFDTTDWVGNTLAITATS